MIKQKPFIAEYLTDEVIERWANDFEPINESMKRNSKMGSKTKKKAKLLKSSPPHADLKEPSVPFGMADFMRGLIDDSNAMLVAGGRSIRVQVLEVQASDRRFEMVTEIKLIVMHR